MRSEEFYTDKPITSLQTMLRHISETDPRILPVIPDGQYGSNTYASVLSFQEAYGLPPTGTVDQATWDMIVSAYDSALPAMTLPSTRPAWAIGQTVQPGQFNYHIYLVQAMLAALADFFPNLAAPAVTGTLDPVTAEGLRYVQAAGGLSQTGALNTATWYYLNGLYRTMTGDGSK